MSKFLATVSTTAILSTSAAFADPAVMLGGVVTFGGGSGTQFGLTAKLFNDNIPDHIVYGVGVNYFLSSGELGLDAGVGYLFDDDYGVMFGYDFLQGQPTASVGWIDVEAPDSPPVLVETDAVR